MGPIGVPSPGSLATVLILAAVGALAVLGGAGWLIWYLCSHLKWIS